VVDNFHNVVQAVDTKFRLFMKTANWSKSGI